MHIVAITGSFGKTSTKEILSAVLSSKFKTISTLASRNSPVAIAELILKKLRDNHEVFIVEMGAYKKGEIARMCAMVRPTISMVTAINAQHQDLFGSIEHTVEAKYEIVQGLEKTGTAIMNADNEFVKKMILRAKNEGRKVLEYSTKSIEVVQTEKGIEFNSTRVHLFGTHQVSNIVAAMKVAGVLGMTEKEITQALTYVHPSAHTMNPILGVNGSWFMDDTCNNNPDAAIAAIDFLKTKSGKKILVFQPMIELGRYAIESHKRVGLYATRICDMVILTNDSYKEFFPNAKVMNSTDAATLIRKTIGKHDWVLFKGKEAGSVLQLLI